MSAKSHIRQSLITPQNSFLDPQMTDPAQTGNDQQQLPEGKKDFPPIAVSDGKSISNDIRRENHRKEYAVLINRTDGTHSGGKQCLESFYCLCCCAKRRIGDMFVLAEKSDGSPLLIVGPCWPFCAFITVPLILIVSVLIGIFVLRQITDNGSVYVWMVATYFPIMGITLIALFFVSCCDPGLLERVESLEGDVEVGDGVDRSRWIWNDQVGSYRPNGAVYCRECKVSIRIK
mmetsp:Transcript_32915/g.75780  ORF Transcript_32915/g.75780 Transcript_32915/m.75780 type:complete len:232 (-) Transcript_32915:625-1320(-)